MKERITVKEIIPLVVFLSFAITTFFLAVNKHIDTVLAIIMFVFTILSPIVIANLEFIKRIRWKDLEIETFGRKVDKITDEALAKIEKEVSLHKENIENLTTKAQETKTEVERLNRETLKYSFFVMDPFTGLANTGGGHAIGVTYATETDLGKLILKAQEQIKNKQYDPAEITTHDIENIFPNYPGAAYIKFLIYRETGQKDETLNNANRIIDFISEFNISNIRPEICDVYKHAIQWNLSNSKESNAKKIAKKALMFWPEDVELKSIGD